MGLAETLRDSHGDAGMLAVTLLLEEIWVSGGTRCTCPGAPLSSQTVTVLQPRTRDIRRYASI